MTDVVENTAFGVAEQGAVEAMEPGRSRTSDAVARSLRRRYAAQRRMIWFGWTAISLALLSLMVLIGTIGVRGYSAFWQTYLTIDVDLKASAIDPDGTRDPEVLNRANYAGLARRALRDMFPEVKGRRDRRALGRLLSVGAGETLREMVLDDPSMIGRTITVAVPASDDVDMFVKGNISRESPASGRKVSDQQIAWIDALSAHGRVGSRFNTRFLSSGDSREPELAGIWSAVVGSFFTMVVTLALSFPFGVATAVYLEMFAPKNRWTDIIEVNINNLAAVPSIVFGLLGLAVFLAIFGLPRSAPVVGGMVLALMTLPTVIIAGRAALDSVPPSIREGALAVGASPVQAVFHHVLPLAMPGILTGSIIGMARALGETAPLLMIGMVAFIVDVPSGPTDPSTVLPVQIFLWADSPERAFVEKTAAATLVLLAFLIVMNAAAVYLRKRFEKRW